MSGRREIIDRLVEDGGEMAVTWEIAKQVGNILNAWRQRGRTLSLPDVTVAAVALTNDLILLTGNMKDFPMPELHIYPLP